MDNTVAGSISGFSDNDNVEGQVTRNCCESRATALSLSCKSIISSKARLRNSNTDFLALRKAANPLAAIQLYLMKKVTTILTLFLCVHFVNGQERALETKKYAGTYLIGDVRSTEGGSRVDVYPESDSTVLIYVYIQNSAPSYNFGRLYGRVKILNGKGNFLKKIDDMDISCHWLIELNKDALIVTTINRQYNCEFGNGVYADGKYKKVSSKIPKYFIQGDGEKVYFSKVTPEEYLDTL